MDPFLNFMVWPQWKKPEPFYGILDNICHFVNFDLSLDCFNGGGADHRLIVEKMAVPF